MIKIFNATQVLSLTAVLIILSSSAAPAASVATIKGKKALINLDGDAAMEGEEYYLVDPNTRRKTAIIRIQRVKGEKALAEILKGRGETGFSLQAKAISTEIASSGEPLLGNLEPRFQSSLRDSFGVTASYHLNSMTADITFRDALQITQKASASMTGSGFGVGGFYDYVFMDSLAARGHVALEQFNVTGSTNANACAGTTSCDAKINYLSSYALLKWYPVQGAYRVWVGGGLGFLFAISKSSSALNEGQISTNQIYTGALGLDIQMNRQNYIPLSFEYNSFPSSGTVTANTLTLKAGWAWNL